MLFLLSHTLILTEGFLPTHTRLVAANWALSSHGESTTHKGMAMTAILQAAATVLAEYPSSNSLGSQNVRQFVNSNSEFDVPELVFLYYGSRSIFQWIKIRGKFDFYNEQVDQRYGEFAIAKAHFDSEQFESSQDHLVSLRRATTNKISNK